jgi:hypothetical protein
MPQSNQSILKRKYQFKNLIFSDPELEKNSPDEGTDNDIPYQEVIPEDAPPRHNVPDGPQRVEKPKAGEAKKPSDDSDCSNESWRDNPPNQHPLPNP